MGACEVRWACGCVAFRCGQATNTKDLYSADLLSYDSVSVRGLDNKKGQRGGEAGLVELYLFKQLAQDYLCGKFMEDRHIGAEPKAKIREICVSVPTFRKYCGWSSPMAKAPKVDMTWQYKWSRSAEKVLELIEAR